MQLSIWTNPLFTLWDYPLTLLEILGTLTGLLAVFFAARSNIITWPIGIVNVICFFFMFYTVQLYSDMLLQVYYFVVSIYGWIAWQKKGDHSLEVQWMKKGTQFLIPILVLIFSVLLGYLIAHIHEYFPKAFPKPADYPYIDTAIAVMSVIATYLQARKKIESWIIWIVTDTLCTLLYWVKGIHLFSMEYLVFTILAVFGFLSWQKEMKSKTH
ncbi:MAG: nicotinamide riboside transporter PnuC [Flavobacteriales bacterium]|nr:nicotinamide riboside transporter PnuC [Flavobacteriales bacterium]